MTTADLGALGGASTQAIRRWIRDISIMHPDSTIAEKRAHGSSHRPADYSRGEVKTILSYGLGTMRADVLLRQIPLPCKEGSKPDTGMDSAAGAHIDLQDSIPQEMLSRILCALATVAQSIEPSPRSHDAYPAQEHIHENPPKTLRDAVRRIVTEYGYRHGHAYQAAWKKLYRAYEAVRARNVRSEAKGKGLETLDYIEQSGDMGYLVILAAGLFGGHIKAA